MNKDTITPITGGYYYLGIDGGGSKCKACVADAEGRVLGTAVSGPANPFHGIKEAQQSIEMSARAALEDAHLPPETLDHLVAGAGLAGVNLPNLYQRMSEWSHPFAALYLTTDLRIACLGAHQRDDGAVIVIGTGSSGYARADGVDLLLGGYGFAYGDQGSGAWMGLEAVRAILLASDQLGPQTILSQSVDKLLQASGITIVERLAGRPSSEFAKLAPLVFTAAEAGDPVAMNILNEGAGYISSMASKLLEYQPARLALIGGLADRIEPWLTSEVRSRLSAPIGPPEVGALMFARHSAGQCLK